MKVLDHGFVEVIDKMGDDLAIAQAARISFGRTDTAGARGLIRYLMRHWHTSPFEMCEIKLHLKMPIFVARQWIRHRTANVNEISGRYKELPAEFYLSEPQDIAHQSSSNKQGRGDRVDYELAEAVRNVSRGVMEEAFDTYQCSVADGIAKELARTVLPLSTYTEFVWKIDLHNLLHFLQLRLDPHAQLEIRRYAEVIADIVEDWVPLAWSAFCDYRRDAVTFSAQEWELLKTVLYQPIDISADTMLANGLSKGEINEFMEKISDFR